MVLWSRKRYRLIAVALLMQLTIAILYTLDATFLPDVPIGLEGFLYSDRRVTHCEQDLVFLLPPVIFFSLVCFFLSKFPPTDKWIVLDEEDISQLEMEQLATRMDWMTLVVSKSLIISRFVDKELFFFERAV